MRKEIGFNLGAGAALGVEDSTQSVISSVAKQMKAVQAEYRKRSEFSVNLNAAANTLRSGLYSISATPTFAVEGM